MTAEMVTLPDGRLFPSYNGETLSWTLSMTLRDEQEGYPRTLTVARAMRDHRPEQLASERREMLKGSFDRMFGHNARKCLALIDSVIAEVA